MKAENRRVGLRWGLLLAHLQDASAALGLAASERMLLSERLQEELSDLASRIIGLNQRAWEEEGRSAMPPRPSAEVRAARAPRPPGEMVGALQDRLNPASGRLLAAKPVRPPRRK